MHDCRTIVRTSSPSIDPFSCIFEEQCSGNNVEGDASTCSPTIFLDFLMCLCRRDRCGISGINLERPGKQFSRAQEYVSCARFMMSGSIVIILRRQLAQRTRPVTRTYCLLQSFRFARWDQCSVRAACKAHFESRAWADARCLQPRSCQIPVTAAGTTTATHRMSRRHPACMGTGHG